MEDDLCNKWALDGRENETGKMLLLSFQSQPVDQTVNNEPYLKKSSHVFLLPTVFVYQMATCCSDYGEERAQSSPESGWLGWGRVGR